MLFLLLAFFVFVCVVRNLSAGDASARRSISPRRALFGNELVTCGCTSTEQEGLVRPTGSVVLGPNHVKAHKAGARGSIRGRGGSGKGAGAIFADATGVALVSRVLGEDTG